MNKRNANYQQQLDEIIAQNLVHNKRPSLLMHVCCAPCSSYCLEYLSEFFEITLLFYNPNISPQEEFCKRLDTLKKFVGENYPSVIIQAPAYDEQEFFAIADGLQDAPEGGARCWKCYALRLEKTAQIAREKHFDYFLSSLSISPHKNVDKLNEIGQALALKYGVEWLPNDFKKKGGYLRSIELSAKNGLYRQNFCGCEYSKRENQAKQVAQNDKK
ncbi:MAG: epoxyqueuosine reductase QueH [Clostridia bacterium]